MSFAVFHHLPLSSARLWAAAAVVGGAAVLSGCVVAPLDDSYADYGYTSTTVYTHYGYPPPPRVEYRYAAPTPSHIWIGGDWFWGGSRYDWRPGYWAPPGYRHSVRPPHHGVAPHRPMPSRPSVHPGAPHRPHQGRLGDGVRPPHARPTVPVPPPSVRPERPRPPHWGQGNGGERPQVRPFRPDHPPQARPERPRPSDMRPGAERPRPGMRPDRPRGEARPARPSEGGESRRFPQRERERDRGPRGD